MKQYDLRPGDLVMFRQGSPLYTVISVFKDSAEIYNPNGAIDRCITVPIESLYLVPATIKDVPIIRCELCGAVEDVTFIPPSNMRVCPKCYKIQERNTT